MGHKLLVIFAIIIFGIATRFLSRPLEDTREPNYKHQVRSLNSEQTQEVETLDLNPGGSSFADTSRKTRVNCFEFASAENAAVILIFGQSNAANESDPKGMYLPERRVINFNFFDGLCYLAEDPLLGQSQNRSSFATRLGDLLIQRDRFNSVILIPIASGGSFIHEWTPGNILFQRAAIAIKRAEAAGLRITHAIWQQGEAEGGQRNPDGEKYQANFLEMLGGLRDAGLRSPVYVALSTICKGEANNTIREAQQGLINENLGILLGADTDQIPLDDRWDQCHFSKTGLVKAAELWYSVLTR